MINKKELKSNNNMVSFIPYILNLLIGVFFTIYFYLGNAECNYLCGLRMLLILWVWIFLFVHSLVFIISKKFYKYISNFKLYIISVFVALLVYLIVIMPLGNLIAYYAGW